MNNCLGSKKKKTDEDEKEDKEESGDLEENDKTCINNAQITPIAIKQQ